MKKTITTSKEHLTEQIVRVDSDGYTTETKTKCIETKTEELVRNDRCDAGGNDHDYRATNMVVVHGGIATVILLIVVVIHPEWFQELAETLISLAA